MEPISGNDLTSRGGVVALSKSSDWTIRKATSADAHGLAELGKITYTQTFSHAYLPGKLEVFLHENFAVEKIREDLNNEHVMFFLAEAGGKPAGYAKLVQHSIPSGFSLPDPIELERLYILRNWHGSGLANKFIDICIAEAQQLTFKTLWLAVWEHNDRAKAFYSKEGFRQVAVTKVCDGVKLQVMAQEL
jgi:diamine N-acetyltransferase